MQHCWLVLLIEISLSFLQTQFTSFTSFLWFNSSVLSFNSFSLFFHIDIIHLHFQYLQIFLTIGSFPSLAFDSENVSEEHLISAALCVSILHFYSFYCSLWTNSTCCSFSFTHSCQQVVYTCWDCEQIVGSL